MIVCSGEAIKGKNIEKLCEIANQENKVYNLLTGYAALH